MAGRRTHVVTGAGSGIGAVLAARLHERGDRLVLPARSTERAAQLTEQFPGAEAPVTDLAEISTLEATLDALDLPERLDSVVHAAGVVELGPVAEQTAAAWQETLAVNLVAPALLTRWALPGLRRAGGTVVMVNSGAGLVAHADWASYAASKHGLKALADALRAEEREHGVRVTSVHPGRVATAMQAEVHRQEGREYDAADWIDAGTVAAAILHVLDLPPDATLTDLSLKPR